MPLQIIRNDILCVKADAIVNPTDCFLSGSGSLDAKIHQKAGSTLKEACRAIGGCKVGEAVITPGGALLCRYVIHTAGPQWQGGAQGEEELLRSCYWNALTLAEAHHCEHVAFPLVASGVYGYPKDQALRLAVDTISRFLLAHEMLVTLVVYDKTAFQISEKLFADISAYIDDHYVDAHKRDEPPYGESTIPGLSRASQARIHGLQLLKRSEEEQTKEAEAYGIPIRRQTEDSEACAALIDRQLTDALKIADLAAYGMPIRWQTEDSEACAASIDRQYADAKSVSLESFLRERDESFSQLLLRQIDASGMTDVQVYKKANIDRKLFSKIRSDASYRPSKSTVLAFAIALELSLAETKELLERAGFALSRAFLFDTIIEFFIVNHNYNIYEINEALFAFDQNLLGG